VKRSHHKLLDFIDGEQKELKKKVWQLQNLESHLSLIAEIEVILNVAHRTRGRTEKLKKCLATLLKKTPS